MLNIKMIYLNYLLMFIVISAPRVYSTSLYEDNRFSIIDIPKPCCEIYSLNLTQFQSKYRTVILMMDSKNDYMNHTNNIDFIKNCYIRNSGENQTFTIYNDLTFSTTLWRGIRKLALRQTNILIFVKFPSIAMLEEGILKMLLYAKWSLFIIVATTEDNKYNCKEGLTTDVLTEIENFVNALWHKFLIMNLIITFPLVCPNHYIVYGKNTYVDNNSTLYNRSIELTPRKLEALKLVSHINPIELTQNFPLQTNIFERFPTAIRDCEGIKNYIPFKRKFSKGFCGIDGLIMSDIVKYFGFNLSKYQQQGTSSYGYVTKSGKVTGSLGTVIRGEVDISFNSRFMAPYGVTGFHFLHYVSYDSLCAMVKRSDEVPLWLFPYDVYNLQMWSLLLSILILVGLFLWLHAKCSKELSNKSIKIQYYVIESLTTGLFGFSMIKTRFLILRSVCFFSSVIFTSLFQGHVNYAYTTMLRYDQINSLQNLLQSGAKIYSTYGIINLIEPPYNELQVALMNRVIMDTNATYEEVVIKNTNAVVTRRSDMILQTMKYFTDSNGNLIFHVVDECFRLFLLSFIAARGFPFIDQVTLLVQKLIEAGLPEQYYQWTQRSIGLFITTADIKDSAPRPTSPIAMQDMRIAFGLLAIGYVLASIAFAIEKWNSQCSR